MQEKDTFNEFINELIDKNDILEVVRGYVDLTRKGNSYWGRCPFHHEKTASFHVEERLKIYKCFGCGAAGNVIKFVQEIESVSFMEAVKILADRVGMEVPKFSKRKDEDLESKKKSQEKHMEIVAVSARYYNAKLVENPKIISFLASRGIDRKIITKYGLGYSQNHFGLVNHLLSLGYMEKDIEDAGVCVTTQEDKFQDVMAGRIICPIINTFGKVTGFAGSVRNGDTIYTKNTDIFRRDSEVFGTHVLKQIKVNEGIDHLIITSTPINAVSLYAKGETKILSVMDNTISSKQARAIRRFTDKFTIVFSDETKGIDKAYAGIDSLIEEGGSVKVATLCEHINVLELIENRKVDYLLNTIKNAKSLLEYQLKKISSKYDLATKDGKDAFIEEAKSYVLAIKERSKQEPFISVLSKMAKVREDSIRKAFYEDSDKTNKGVKRISNKRTKDYNAMMTLLALDYKGYAIGEDITPYLYGEYLDYYENKSDDINLTAYFNDKEIAMLEEADVNDKNNAKLVRDCIKTLKDVKAKREIDEIVALIDKENDLDKKQKLMAKLNELMKRNKRV